MMQPPPAMVDSTPGARRCRDGIMFAAITDLIICFGTAVAWVIVGFYIQWWGFTIPAGILSLGAVWSILILVLKNQRWPSIVFIVWTSLRLLTDICIFSAVMFTLASNRFNNLGPSSYDSDGGYPSDTSYTGTGSGGSGSYPGGSSFSRSGSAAGTGVVSPVERAKFYPPGSGNYKDPNAGLYYYVNTLGTAGLVGWGIAVWIIIILYFVFLGIACGYCLSFGERYRKEGYGYGYPSTNPAMIISYPTTAQQNYNQGGYYAQPPPNYQYQAPGSAPAQPQQQPAYGYGY